MKPWLLLAPAAFLGVAFFRPLAATFAHADAAGWRWVLTHPLVQDRLIGALVMAALSVLATFALAVPLAWFYRRRTGTASRIELAIHAAPFVMPVFVVIFGIQAILGRHGWLHNITGLDLLASVGPLGAIVIAHAYYNYGFAARLMHAALERRPHRLEHAAQNLGASPFAAFTRVTLPLLMPAVASIALLVFLFSFTSFGIVLYMGQGDLATLEVLLYENLRGAFPRLERAAALGILQLTLNFIVLSIYLRMLRRQIQVPREPASDRMPSRAGRWVGAAAAGVAIMPLVAVLTGGFQVRGKWSLEPWNALLRSNHPSHAPGFELGHAIGLSLGYAVASATIALALTICLAYGVRRLHPWAHTLASLVTALPLGTSSLLIGFGLILSTSVAFVADAANGRLLIIAAHALVAFPFTARTLLPAIAQLETRLDESARLLGASSWAVVGRVHLPLLAAPLIAALGLSLAMSLGDFGAGLLLMSAENRGISLWIDAIGGSVQFNPILRAQASALAGLLLLLAAAAYASAEWAIRRPA